ncbi:hypothetical protein ACEQ8H_003289 [Pleosporales sp. CAS-2024a]
MDQQAQFDEYRAQMAHRTNHLRRLVRELWHFENQLLSRFPPPTRRQMRLRARAQARHEDQVSDIDPLNFSQVVQEMDRPRGQNCTICVEEYLSNDDGTRCVKLDTCGHYFHDICLGKWLNCTAAASNLCPECRSQICPKRRAARSETASPPTQSTGLPHPSGYPRSPFQTTPPPEVNDSSALQDDQDLNHETEILPDALDTHNEDNATYTLHCPSYHSDHESSWDLQPARENATPSPSYTGDSDLPLAEDDFEFFSDIDGDEEDHRTLLTHRTSHDGRHAPAGSVTIRDPNDGQVSWTSSIIPGITRTESPSNSEGYHQARGRYRENRRTYRIRQRYRIWRSYRILLPDLEADLADDLDEAEE